VEGSLDDSGIISAFSRHTFLKQACEDLWPELELYSELLSSHSAAIIKTFEPDARFYVFALKGKTIVYKGTERISEITVNQTFTWAFLLPGNTLPIRLEASLPVELIIIQFANTSHAFNVENQLLGRLTRWFTLLPEPGSQSMEREDDLLGLLKKYKQTQNHLFSIFNHDLRSPVASFISLLDLAQNELNDGNYNMVAQLLVDLRELAEIHLKMLENLKRWAELRAGRHKPNFRATTVQEILNNVLSLTLPYFQKKEIHLINNVMHSETQLYTDLNFSIDLLKEILVNSCKFSYRHKQVIIESEIQEHRLAIKVLDEGKGFKPYMLKDLFIPGKNKIDYGTENEPGTGLGLLIAKDIADLLGIEIRVASEFGKGSIFTLLFPMVG
jgi:signal transduction histidine kinase